MENDLFISCEIWTEAKNVSKIFHDVCKRIDEKNYDISRYTENIESIGIIINCFPNELLIDGWGKPRKYISYKNKYADIRLPIPYDNFMNANYDKQYLMVVDNIIQSLRIIDEKCTKSKKAKFDSVAIIDDLLQRLEISYDDIEGVVGVLSDDEYIKIVNGQKN